MRPKRFLMLGVLLALVVVIGTGGAWGLGVSTKASAPQISAVVNQEQAHPTLEWFGWSHFRITTTDGTVFIINPFITGNPDASVTLDDIARADYILVPNGHRDEQGDAIAIAQKTGARVLTGGYELGSWMIQQGVPPDQVIRSNPGNWHDLGGVTVRVVNSVHGSGLPEPTIENPYGGPAAGFFITLENGYTVYFAGSTAATMDMQLWGSMFKPDLAILPLNSDRDPVDVAQMVRLLSVNNPNLARVIPHHHRVEPGAGDTTIQQMEESIRALADSPVTVLKLRRGQVVWLQK
jgi:L-ascorbate metabolism protein UlaG (beta-lactamase superfamily)